MGPGTCRTDGKGSEGFPVRRIIFPRVTAGMIDPLATFMGMLTQVGPRNDAAEGRRCPEAPLSRMGARDISAGGNK